MAGQPMTLRDWALLILRLGIGITFIAHGYSKVFPSGPGGFAGFVQSLGFPGPLFFAWVVAITEFFGGIAMVIGFMVRFVGPLMVIEMIVTTVRVKVAGGVGFIEMQRTGWELDFLLLCVAAALTLAGAGALSLDAALRSRRTA
ncbi:MAG TPA: DoxX family protein [bacterium]|nr:DoxX family protein [bacterium]